jgi:chromate reductase, NAD(P)H dehydrogenase (quinone)
VSGGVDPVMKVLAISGSLRAASINSALLRAATQLAPPGMCISFLRAVGELPIFNPDLEDPPPPLVAVLRAEAASADALLIASPEYAHGVTGALKNLLDWLVGLESFAGKPVAVLNTSLRSHHADSALREILRTMSAVIVEAASVRIPLYGADLGEDRILESPEAVRAIRRSLLALSDATAQRKPWPDAASPLS